MEQQSSVPLQRCAICGVPKPKSPHYYYRNAGNPGGLSKSCKPCSDAAKKKYKAKYDRNAMTRIGVRHEKTLELSPRVQYALWTRRCPRVQCGGPLQQEVDSYVKLAPCLTCLMCSRQVWLPPMKDCRKFLKENPRPRDLAPPPRVKKRKRVLPHRNKI